MSDQKYTTDMTGVIGLTPVGQNEGFDGQQLESFDQQNDGLDTEGFNDFSQTEGVDNNQQAEGFVENITNTVGDAANSAYETFTTTASAASDAVTSAFSNSGGEPTDANNQF